MLSVLWLKTGVWFATRTDPDASFTVKPEPLLKIMFGSFLKQQRRALSRQTRDWNKAGNEVADMGYLTTCKSKER